MDCECRVCGEFGPAREKPGLSFCTACKIARYCGPACQKEDWKKHGHRAECAALQSRSVDTRAMFVTLTLDVSLFSRTEFFFTLVLMVIPSATGSSVAPVVVEISSRHDVEALARAVSGSLKAMGGILPGIFRYPKHTLNHAQERDDEDIGLPIGLPGAVTACADDITARLKKGLDGPARSFVEIQAVTKVIMEDISRTKKMWTAAAADGTTGVVTLGNSYGDSSDEARRYDEKFFRGVTDMHPYPHTEVPVGSRVTVFHFSNGYFYKRLDLTACRRGLAPERTMAFAPRSIVLDCRTLRTSGELKTHKIENSCTDSSAAPNAENDAAREQRVFTTLLAAGANSARKTNKPPT